MQTKDRVVPLHARIVALLTPVACLAAACAPAESVVSPTSPGPRGPTPGMESSGLLTAPFHLASKQPLPEGCFAWSARAQAAACTIGRIGSNMGGSDWHVQFVGDPSTPALDFGADMDPGNDSPARAARQRVQLEATLTNGGYVELKPIHRRLQAGKPLAWEGAELLWTRKQTFAGGDNQAPRYTDTFEIRWEAGSAPVTIGSREDAPVDSPEVAVYMIPGGRFAVVSDVAGYGDEGISGTSSNAWRCDRVEKRCQ